MILLFLLLCYFDFQNGSFEILETDNSTTIKKYRETNAKFLEKPSSKLIISGILFLNFVQKLEFQLYKISRYIPRS